MMISIGGHMSQAQNGDAIDRAMARNAVVPGSAL
jgi:hypothetical protein